MQTTQARSTALSAQVSNPNPLDIPRFSIALLPKLSDASLLSIIEWRLQVAEVMKLYAPVPDFCPLLIIEPAIWQAALAVCGAPSNTIPENVDEAYTALLQAFAPKSDQAKTSLLRSAAWTQPTPIPGKWNVVAGLAAHIKRFHHLLAALKVDKVSAPAQLFNSIKGDLGRLCRGSSELRSITTWDEAVKTVMSHATQIDQLAAEGYVRATSPSHKLDNSGYETQSRSSYAPLARTRGSQPSTTPRSIPRSAVGLPPEEVDNCFRRGLCLKCRQPGHRAADCPTPATPTSTASHAPRSPPPNPRSTRSQNVPHPLRRGPDPRLRPNPPPVQRFEPEGNVRAVGTTFEFEDDGERLLPSPENVEKACIPNQPPPRK